MKLYFFSLFCVILYVSEVKSQNSTINTSTTTVATTTTSTKAVPTTTTITTTNQPTTSSKNSGAKGCILSQSSKYETNLLEKIKPLFGDK
jgi:hypothetical protein